MSESPMVLGRKVCAALGLDESKVTAIDIRFAVADFPRVMVEYVNIVDGEFVNSIVGYELKPIEVSK